MFRTISLRTAIVFNVPEDAQNAIVDFSRYLRENLDFLTSSNMIPFNKELEHVNKYVNLEKLRFGDKIPNNYISQGMLIHNLRNGT